MASRCTCDVPPSPSLPSLHFPHPQEPLPLFERDENLLGPGGLRHSGRQESMGDWVNIDSGYELIQPHVFEKIFPTLFSLYALHHEEQDSCYMRGIKILNTACQAPLFTAVSSSFGAE